MVFLLDSTTLRQLFREFLKAPHCTSEKLMPYKTLVYGHE